MNYIQLTKENIDKEHLCCATSNKLGTAAKRAWLKQQLDQGLYFLKGDVSEENALSFRSCLFESKWICAG